MSVNVARRNRLVLSAVGAALVTACTLITAKFYAWQLTGSAAMLGALLDSATDLVATLLNGLAVRAAIQPADHNHRFGHGKAEPLAALAQCALIGVSALFIVHEAANRLWHPQPLTAPAIGLWVAGLSVVATALLVWWQQYVVKHTHSAAIAADRIHYRSDLWLNGVLLLNFMLAGFWWQPYADGVLSLFVAGNLLHGSWEIMRHAARELMDEELPAATRKQIYNVAMAAHPLAADLHDLRTRIAGGRMFVQFHLAVESHMTVAAAHAVTEAVELALAQEFANMEVFIHLDPANHPAEHPMQA